MLEVRVLGQFEARLFDQPLNLPSRPAQSLLAYLMLTAGQGHRREKLAGMFWPDAAEAKARGYLRQTLWRLRKVLEPDAPVYLAADDLSISFLTNSNYWLDAAILERGGELSASVAAYRGELLPGFYDEWVLLERERLRGLFERKMSSLLERLGSQQRWGEVIEWGERWVALGNLPEAAYRAMMTAHAKLDDPAGAAAVYQRCAELLWEDLGMEPSIETRALHTRIQAGSRPRPLSLPVHPTPLIGREQELAEVGGLLADPGCRLLTLVGPGGIGKTRLALAAAHAQASLFADGAGFVSLASLTSSQYLIPTVASGLGLSVSAATEPQAQLISQLRDRDMLIVLDSFEPLESAATLLAEILTAAKGIKLLVTARERLHLLSEWVYELLGLDHPQRAVGAAEAGHYGALRLFVQCARRQRPNFSLSEPEAEAAARLCRWLGGLPLGIELAAAWVRSYTCAEIADELQRNVGFLNTTLRDVPERHRSLEAVFNHAWGLLTPDEQSAFQAQAVFRGGFTRAAAQQVTSASAAQLVALVDKSLLRRTSAARFEAHELPRHFAYDQLVRSGQLEALADRHAAYFVAFAESAEPKLHGPRQAEWLTRLEADHDNFRAALEWTMRRGQAEQAARLAVALWWFWYLRGYLVEGRAWLKQVLALGPALPAAVEAGVLYGAASLAWFQGDFAAVRALAGGSVALWRKLGTPHGLGAALTCLGLAQGYRGDLALARSLLEESVATFREAGDDWGLALALFHSANPQASGLRDAAMAEWLLGESLRLFEKTGDPWGMALPMHSLGEWQYEQEEFGAARARLEAALELRRKVGDNWLVAQTLAALGDVARCENDDRAAETLYEEALDLYQAIGSEGRSGALLHHLACVALRQQDYGRAAALLAQSLRLFHQLADSPGLIADLEGVAGLLSAQGRSLPATRLLGAAEALRAAHGVNLVHADRVDHERAVAAALLSLPLESFEVAWAEGRAMTLVQATEAALAS
jgi:predicted ATPase/DNA-binding SARP family transcriptional activator/tetratricopeptide (TPR) repeat protein